MRWEKTSGIRITAAEGALPFATPGITDGGIVDVVSRRLVDAIATAIAVKA